MILKSIFSSTVVIASLLAVAEAQNLSQITTPPRNAVTSYAVMSCGGVGGLSVSDFGMIYYRFNRSVEFSMIGAAQQGGLSPTMNIDVTAYGTKLPTQVIDLCDYASCPLFQSSTTIQGAKTVNRSFTDQIPGIFWSLPLDPTVKLTFFSTSDNSILGCLTATLSNGVTTKNAAIPWVTGILTILLIIAAGVLGNIAGVKAANAPGGNGLGMNAAAAGHPGTTLATGNTPGVPHTAATTTAPTGHSGPPAGHMDPITLFLHFQSVSFTGLLSLNYPSVYHAFTTNFAWANFIIPLKAFRKAAAHMRKCNVDKSNVSTSYGVSTVNSGLGVSSGIANYAGRLGVNEQDVFGVIYLVFLCACGVLLAIYILVGAIMHVKSLASKDEEGKEVWTTRRRRWGHMSSNNTLRLLLVALGTLATFAFHQWTQKCTSGLTFFLTTSVLAFALLTLGLTSFLILRISKRPDGLPKLFAKDSIYGRRWGSMYDTLNERHLYFAVVLWVIAIIRAAITGFGQSNGLAQVVAMTVLQLVVCTTLFKFQPYYSRGYNRVSYLLEGTKLISHVLLFLFVDTFHINPIATTASGFVLLAINSAVALLLIVLIVLQLGWGRLWYRRKHIAFEKNQNIEKSQNIEGVHDSLYYGQTVSTSHDEEK